MPQQQSRYNSTGYNLRAYFSPALNVSSFFRQELDANSVTANIATKVVNNMLEGNCSVLPAKSTTTRF